MPDDRWIFSSWAFSFIKEAKKISEATGIPVVIGKYSPLSYKGSGLVIGNPDDITMRIIRTTQFVKFKCYLVIEGIVTNGLMIRFFQNFENYCPSEFVKECLEQVDIPVAEVIPHAIKEVHNRRITKREKAKLLYIAWWHNFLPRKYPKECIEALKMIKYPFELVILTSPDNRYKSELKKYGKVIDKIGKLTEEELLNLYLNADYYVSFSTSEGFGVPILEALSCGLPVIHVNAKPFVEITNEKCSIRFDYDKVKEHPCPNFKGLLHIYKAESLAEAINNALEIYYNDFEKYKEMCEEAYKRARDFTYENTYVKFKEII